MRKLGIILGLNFVLLAATSNGNAAQLVNSIPTELRLNWIFCLHYSNKKPICRDTALPLNLRLIDDEVRYQSFHKEFIISRELSESMIALWLQEVDDVDEVKVNGRVIGRTGRFPPDFETGYRQPRLYLIPSRLINYDQFNTIDIKTFSSRNIVSIRTKPPMLGDFLALSHRIQEEDHVFFMAITMLLLLTVFQIFYFIMVKSSRETVYLFLFLITMSLIAFARSQAPLHMGLDLSLIIKIEAFMYCAAMISIAMFLFKFFEIEVRKTHISGMFVIGFCGVVAIIWPITLQSRLLAEFNQSVLLILSLVISGSAVVIAIRKQRKYAWLVAATCLLSWLVMLYDAMMHSSLLANNQLTLKPELLPLTTASIGVIFALTITHKYWLFFKGATYDHLTGTLLRPAFFQRLSEEMQRSQRGTSMLLVAVVDIKQVKKISQNYGYSIGNHLLSVVSNSLTKVLRPFDLICRFSDEEFCIAAAITNRQDAESCIQRIYQELVNIQQPINEDIEILVDAKIGGVIYNPDQHLSVSQLLQDANYGLAKAKGDNKTNYLLIQNPTVTA